MFFIPRINTQSQHSAALTVRAGSGNTLLLQASNDTIVDGWGTVITAEALMRDWWTGYQQHRTVSLQHNLPELRGIKGAPNIGRTVRVDFMPQLTVEVEVNDPELLEQVKSGRLASASLEFKPLDAERRGYRGEDAQIYHRLSSEPEHCGLSIVDIPGVPGSDLISIRSLPALWAYAVVDPLVVNGEITDPELVNKLVWFPHHDEVTHVVDEALLNRAIADLDSNNYTVPPEASLTAADVATRARAHLERHTHLGLGRRARRRAQKEGKMNKQQWLESRAAQYLAEGLDQDAAANQAQKDWENLPTDVRTRIDTEEPGLLARLFGGNRRLDITVNGDTPLQQRAEPEAEEEDEDEKAEAKGAEETPAAAAPTDAELDEAIGKRIAKGVEKELERLAKRPESPMAAIASGLQVRSSKLDREAAFGEIMARTVLKQAQNKEVTADDRQYVDNVLKEQGVSTRALTIEGNGTVIYEELARQFVVKPASETVFRNHFRSLPMQGVKKSTFPRFDRGGFQFEWNRQNTATTGSLTDINETDPTLDAFSIEVTEMNGATRIADSFLHFNTSGASFVGQYLLPELRGAAQGEEDHQFFLANGSSPGPDTFRGLRHATGVTDANPGTTVTQFSEAVLSLMLRAMPAAFRKNPDKLRFYLPLPLGDDFAEIRLARATALGDQYAEDRNQAQGPVPIGRYRGVPVFGIPELPTDENGDEGTAYLTHADTIAIGDGLTIRIEPHRLPNFQTLIQIQQFVGLGYAFPTSVVRFSNITAKASN